MIGAINVLGRNAALTMYADWTDRIAAGEVCSPRFGVAA